MIAAKYYELLYRMEPLPVAMDLSECALEQALIQHKFKLDDSEYILVLGREYIREIIQIIGGLNIFKISVEIQEDLLDHWYLVNESRKHIIYSPGV